MLRTTNVRRDVTDHDSFTVADEGVLENEGEFATTEWFVSFGLI